MGGISPGRPHEVARTVTVTRRGTTIVLTVGLPVARVNGRPVPVDVPPRNVGGRVLVPLRFLSEHLGGTVIWDGDKRAVRISPISPQPASSLVLAP